MCGFGANQVGDYVSLDGANVSRHRFTYESELGGLSKGVGSDPFTNHCERVEAAKEGICPAGSLLS